MLFALCFDLDRATNRVECTRSERGWPTRKLCRTNMLPTKFDDTNTSLIFYRSKFAAQVCRGAPGSPRWSNCGDTDCNHVLPHCGPLRVKAKTLNNIGRGVRCLLSLLRYYALTRSISTFGSMTHAYGQVDAMRTFFCRQAFGVHQSQSNEQPLHAAASDRLLTYTLSCFDSARASQFPAQVDSVGGFCVSMAHPTWTSAAQVTACIRLLVG